MKGAFSRPVVAMATAVVAMASAPTAMAEPILSVDFQSGHAEGWAPSGGDVRLTTYAGNISMRLTQNAAVVTSLSTEAFSGVTIAAAMAASGLEAADYCLVEASGDGGRTWIEVLRVADGQDDAVTLHRNAVRDPRLDQADRLLIGARVSGDDADDQCWLDDVRVTGERTASETAQTGSVSPDTLLGRAPLDPQSRFSSFAPPPTAGAPLHVFAGRLVVVEGRGEQQVLTDSLSLVGDAALRLDFFPAFDIGLVQDDGALIPVQRGPVSGGHPNWDIAIEPGRVWSEAGDAGWTRAALPFALVEVNSNCTHNGVLTFLFRDGEISRVAWMIASETCAYLKFDFRGVLEARIESELAADPTVIAAAYRRERGRRMPTRPATDLAALGVDLAGFVSPADVNPEDLTTWGVVYDGVHYRGGCDTRAGPYPFCDALLLPSYSLAKSIVGGFGLMRMEMLLPGTASRRLATLIPDCADWREVTLEHALDMATGRYDSTTSEADENALTSSPFFLSTTLDEKISVACSLYPRREPAGERWVYHTPDTFLLGAGLQQVWQAEHGDERDYFNDVLVEGVFRPLGLSPTIEATRRTLDGEQQAFTGWGLTLLPDDVARIGTYLQNPDVGGDPLMSPEALAAALQRDPSDRGLPAASPDLRYNNGFWAWNAQQPAGCDGPVWIPFMSGYGGIILVTMPNGLTYYYFSDGGDYRWANAVRAASRLGSMCEGG